MKRKILFIVFLFSNMLLFAIMPTEENPNFSNWNWEDQSQANWKMRVANSNNWVNLAPPFAPNSERAGLMVDVHISNDYTKAKGWRLIWAEFNNSGYPYFMLYNPHKSILRVFFYLNNITYSSVLATLQFHNVNNPGVLSMGGEYQNATNAYYNNTTITDTDLLAVVIPKIGANSWGAVDFPIMYDNNIKDTKYNEKKWVFTFYGCDNYDIKINSEKHPNQSNNTDIKNNQYSVSTNKTAINGNTFFADYAKLHKEIQSVEKLMKDMQTSVKTIDSKSPQFLQEYKKDVEKMKSVSDVVSAVSSVSSFASAIFGFIKIISGNFLEKESTKPVAVTEYLQLTGSMNIKQTIKAQTISIPGVAGNYYPQGLSWQPFNCPMGTINLQKVPTIKKTSAYQRIGNYPYQAQVKPQELDNVKLRQDKAEKYPGKYRKYKFDEDIVLAEQSINGLVREEVRFALVCKPTGKNDRKYKINQQYMCYHIIHDIAGNELSVEGVYNLVYKGLEDGTLIVHKFDEANDEIYFGTPYIPMNRFKGVVIEVPEDTEVKLGIMVKFRSDKYDAPVIFKAVYNMNEIETTAASSRIIGSSEQPTFPFSEYRNVITLSTGNNSSTYQTDVIILAPGFSSKPGFKATAISRPETGNTVINKTNFYCSAGNPSYARSLLLEYDNLEEETLGIEELINDENNIVVFPNPTTGLLTIKTSDNKNAIQSLELYNMLGMKVFVGSGNNNSVQEIDISHLVPQTYLLKIQTNGQTIMRKIILQR